MSHLRIGLLSLAGFVLFGCHQPGANVTVEPRPRVAAEPAPRALVEPEPSVAVARTHDAPLVMATDEVSPNIGELAGDYENHLYDGDGKNDWHYVVIVQTDPNTLKWINRAGNSWTLYATAHPDKLLVGEDCPYFDDGHEIVEIHRDAEGRVSTLLGPWGEPYNREIEGGDACDPTGPDDRRF